MSNRQVTIRDVTARDGFQNIHQIIPTSEKVKIVEMLVDSGVRAIEVTSFVHPKWIPQLADSADVFAKIEKKPGMAYAALVPNEKGLDRAIESGVKEVEFVICATDSMNRENQNKSTAESISELSSMARKARDHGVDLNGAVAVCFGCPHEGHVPIEKVYRVVEAFQDVGSPLVSICDSIGVAQPEQVKQVFGKVSECFPDVNLSVHLHNIMGIGLANAYAAYETGLRTFEGCTTGLGGCPYAPRAGGNVATEGLVSMFESMGVDTGIDLERLIQTGEYIRKVVGEAPVLQHGHP